jgi:hypothetical protein
MLVLPYLGIAEGHQMNLCSRLKDGIRGRVEDVRRPGRVTARHQGPTSFPFFCLIPPFSPFPPVHSYLPTAAPTAQISEAWRKRRYPAAFVSKLNDAEGEAGETQTHIEIARRCKYLSDQQAAELDTAYEEILSTLVTIANHPEKWCL